MPRDFFCPRCQATRPSSGLAQRCALCGSVLVARYDYATIGERLTPDDLVGRTKTIWRYRELLPVLDEANIVSLGEGFSPVLALQSTAKEMRISRLFMKDDSVMPLGGFRSRLASVSVSKAREELAPAIIARAGQHEALALAAYAARAGLAAVLLVREDALDDIYEHKILSSGAALFTYTSSDAEAAELAWRSAQMHGWFNASAFYEPYRLDGAKSIGLEIAEVFEWDLPDVILVPAVGGTVLAGIYRAMRDLIELGWIDGRLPRLVAVQPKDSCLLYEAWSDKRLSAPIREGEEGMGFAENVEFANQAEYLALDAIYKSFGAAVSIGLDATARASRLLAEGEGLFVTAAGASTLAAAVKLSSQGWIKPGERVLLYNPEGYFAGDTPLAEGLYARPAPEGPDAVIE